MMEKQVLKKKLVKLGKEMEPLPADARIIFVKESGLYNDTFWIWYLILKP